MPLHPITQEPPPRHPCEGCRHFAEGDYGRVNECDFCARNPAKPKNIRKAKEGAGNDA